MSRETVLARAHAAAALGMVDTCLIQRVNSTIVDSETGKVTPVYATVYTGQCKVQQRAVRGGAPVVVGEASIFDSQLELHLPVNVTTVQPDDVVTITASIDPDLVGRTFHLRGPAHKTYLTARRMHMVEVTS